MLTEPITLTIGTEERTYKRISTTTDGAVYRAKDPQGADDAYLTVKHSSVAKRGTVQRTLIQGMETVNETDTTPESPLKINITFECREDAAMRAIALFHAMVAKLEADNDLVLGSILWGES